MKQEKKVVEEKVEQLSTSQDHETLQRHRELDKENESEVEQSSSSDSDSESESDQESEEEIKKFPRIHFQEFEKFNSQQENKNGSSQGDKIQDPKESGQQDNLQPNIVE